MGIQIQNIPQQLKSSGLWCCWRYVKRDGQDKPTKIPFSPLTGKAARSNDRSTFGRFEQAAFALDMEQYDGLGIGIFDDVCAVDIDNCIENGVFSALAEEIINEMNSYWEVSPSGNGVRILFKAPGLKYDKGRYYINNQKLGLEIYAAGVTNKFVTVTGNAPESIGINTRTEEIHRILERFMRRNVPQDRISKPAIQSPGILIRLDDETIIKKAKRAKNGALFERLMDGNYSDYLSSTTNEPDQSAGDLALCNMLAFWCSKDPNQIDRIFRSSGMMREKWDRPTAGSTYGALTIQRAIDGVTDTYSNQYQKHVERHQQEQKMPVKPRRGCGQGVGTY